MPSVFSDIEKYAPIPGKHPDHTTYRGILNQLRVLGASAISRRTPTPARYLIISRARSGTTLFSDLLGSHPDCTADREVLAKRVIAPVWYLEMLARKAPTQAYGAKLLSYQMVQVQRLRDPRKFMGDLKDRGFLFIHMTRDTFAQTVSLTRAQSSKRFHSTQGSAEAQGVVDPNEFVRRLIWNVQLAEYENACLAAFDPIRINYEEDLSTPERQNAAANRVFAALGLPTANVSSALRKLLPKDPRSALENYDEIASRVTEAGYGALLPSTP